MKTIDKGLNLNQYHDRCVCNICTCHKHRCPHCQIHIPLDGVSSYEKQYVKHPLNPWMKPPPQKPLPYKPYDYINSAYKEDYPGHKPQMRQKIVPRVKNEDRSIPFDGTSEYKKNFPPKQILKEPIKNKDKLYNPDKTPFEGESTYKAQYPKKNCNPHPKKKPIDVKYPDGYKFDGTTTNKEDFTEKPFQPLKNFKPEEKLANSGPYDINSIYKQDYNQKKHPDPCPILKMPKYPSSIHHPHQHLEYNKFKNNWQEV